MSKATLRAHRCEFCKWFVSFEEQMDLEDLNIDEVSKNVECGGSCYYNPPVPLIETRNNDIVSVTSDVHRNHFCRYFETP